MHGPDAGIHIVCNFKLDEPLKQACPPDITKSHRFEKAEKVRPTILEKLSANVKVCCSAAVLMRTELHLSLQHTNGISHNILLEKHPGLKKQTRHHVFQIVQSSELRIEKCESVYYVVGLTA